MVMLPFPTWRPDVSDLAADYTQRLRNVVPRSDGYGPFQDIEAFTRMLPAPCRGYTVAFASDGSVRLFAGTEDKLYLLDNTTLQWGDVSKGSSTYTALAASANWVFCQFGNVVVATQRGDDMQAFDIENDTLFDDLGGDPPRAGWVSRVAKFLVAADLTDDDDPLGIAWSGLNEIDNWTPATNSSDVQSMADGGRPLAVLEAAGDVGLILQENGARRMVFSPGSEAVFDISVIENAPGLLAVYSAVVTRGGVFYLSTKGFMIVGADGAQQPIGEQRVNKTFLGQLAATSPAALRNLAYDDAVSRLVISAADPRSHLVICAYKSIVGETDAGLFDKALLYHTALERWAPLEISGQYLASVSRPGLTLEALGAVAPGAMNVEDTGDNGGEVQIEVASTASLTTGEWKTLSGVGGTTEANGTWEITVDDATHFTLNGSTFANAYVSGGIVEGSVDEIPFSLDSISTATLPALSVCNSDAEIGFFTGDNLEAELLTAEQSLGRQRMDINGLRPITDAAGVFASVRSRGNLNEAETAGGESLMDDDGNCPVLAEGRFVRCALRIPAATQWTFATGIEPDAQPAGDF